MRRPGHLHWTSLHPEVLAELPWHTALAVRVYPMGPGRAHDVHLLASDVQWLARAMEVLRLRAGHELQSKTCLGQGLYGRIGLLAVILTLLRRGWRLDTLRVLASEPLALLAVWETGNGPP